MDRIATPDELIETISELEEVKAIVDHGEAAYNPQALKAVRIAEKLLALVEERTSERNKARAEVRRLTTDEPELEPGLDMDLEQIREGAAALGRIAGRAEAAAQIHRRAYYDAAHAELRDDDEPEEKAPLTPDEVNQRIRDAFSQLSKATQAWLRPNPRRADPDRWTQDELDAAKADAAARHERLKPLLDDPGGRAAEANQDSDREDAKADEERCVDCGLAGEHSHTLCIERAAQFRKTIDEQNDERPKRLTGGPFAPRATGGIMSSPAPGSPIVITGQQPPSNVVQAVRDEIADAIRRQGGTTGLTFPRKDTT